MLQFGFEVSPFSFNMVNFELWRNLVFLFCSFELSFSGISVPITTAFI